jgi:hypothetical protein
LTAVAVAGAAADRRGVVGDAHPVPRRSRTNRGAAATRGSRWITDAGSRDAGVGISGALAIGSAIRGGRGVTRVRVGGAGATGAVGIPHAFDANTCITVADRSTATTVDIVSAVARPAGVGTRVAVFARVAVTVLPACHAGAVPFGAQADRSAPATRGVRVSADAAATPAVVAGLPTLTVVGALRGGVAGMGVRVAALLPGAVAVLLARYARIAGSVAERATLPAVSILGALDTDRIAVATCPEADRRPIRATGRTGATDACVAVVAAIAGIRAFAVGPAASRAGVGGRAVHGVRAV